MATEKTPMAYFVVVSEQGPSWVDTKPMREQRDWDAHAEFMNSLAEDGFVVLGGPIGDETRHRARLVVRTATEADVRARLGHDPWAKGGLLTIESIEEWEVLLTSDPEG